jgi:2,4-dienoyl-CoA reductase-like NADH-dependent reductase (Old Yellow Enzyme family)
MEEHMSRLFEETEINGMKLPNRFVRSATWEGMATTEGTVTPRLLTMMAELAAGGVGLIISSHAYVRKDGQAGIFQLGIYDDTLVKGSGRHDHGRARPKGERLWHSLPMRASSATPN